MITLEDMITDIKTAQASLFHYGYGSVEAAWNFGDRLNTYFYAFRSKQEYASVLSISVATLSKYMAFRDAYQRADLAKAAAEILDTWDVKLLTNLVDYAVPGATPVARHSQLGRCYKHVCSKCGSDDVNRVEVTDPAEIALIKEHRKQRAGAN